MRVEIPYLPRSQFVPFHARGQRWACIVAHRRAGKTVACINELIRGALTCPRPEPRFAYVAPYLAQAKDVAWGYVRQYTAPLPGVEYNEAELRADLPNRGRVRLYGADNYDRLRGSYFDGIVLDEYGDMDPRAWPEVVRPALSDRQGSAVFIGTPRGRNHFYDLWAGDSAGQVAGALHDPDWYPLMLKASVTGILPPAELESARKAMSAEQYAQEYECSFEAANVGAYYGKLMTEAREQKRIGKVPHDTAAPVETWWDLGIGDSTAIWFAQRAGKAVHLIDYYETSGEGLAHYAQVLARKRDAPHRYNYSQHVLPHDVRVRDLSIGKTREDVLKALGITVAVAPDHKVADGIEAVRNLIPRCWFDELACKRGVEALFNYQRKYDDKLKAWRNEPLHDWSSHGSDAFRYGAMASAPYVKREGGPLHGKVAVA